MLFRTEESGRDRTRSWGDGNEVLGLGARDRERREGLLVRVWRTRVEMGWGWDGREGVVYFSFDIDLGSKTGRKRVLNRVRWDIPPLIIDFELKTTPTRL